jgi:hypothetical protein
MARMPWPPWLWLRAGHKLIIIFQILSRKATDPFLSILSRPAHSWQDAHREE